MNSKRHARRLLSLGIAAAAIALATPDHAAAQQRPGGPGGAMANNPGMRLWNALDQRFDGLAEQLAFTDTQTEAVTALVDAFREENKDALGRFEVMASELRSRGRGAGGPGARNRTQRPDRQQMRRSLTGFRDLVQELAPKFETLRTDINGLLEDSQVERLDRFLAQRRPGW